MSLPTPTRGRGPERLLSVENLSVDLPSGRGHKRVVRGVSFAIEQGQSLGVVGKSGSGKTISALAVMGLLPDGAKVSGALNFEGRDLARASEGEMQSVRGDRIGMVFQEPMTALNPLIRVGDQVGEPLRLHRGASRGEARAQAVRLLERVRLRDPERMARAYPFALSGGERQRVMIAMALACGPKLLIADEPTTALDVTVQAKILDLIADLERRERPFGAAGQPRSRGDRPPLPARAGDVRRRGDGGRAGRGGAGPGAAPLHARAAGGAAAARRRARRAAGGDSRRGRRGAGGLRLRRALPARPARVPRDPPAVALGDGHVVRCVRVTADGRLT